MELCVETYRVVQHFPRHELYGLRAQMTRCAVSVPSNIAEGNARGSRRDYARLLGVAKGSTMELETQALIAIRLGYLDQADTCRLIDLLDQTGRMLTTLIARLSS